MNKGNTDTASTEQAQQAAKAAAASQKPPPDVAAQLKRMAKANNDPKVKAVREELKRQGDLSRQHAENPRRPNRAAFQRREFDASGRQVKGEPAGRGAAKAEPAGG